MGQPIMLAGGDDERFGEMVDQFDDVFARIGGLLRGGQIDCATAAEALIDVGDAIRELAGLVTGVVG
jgi:hypothetical protein